MVQGKIKQVEEQVDEENWEGTHWSQLPEKQPLKQR